MEEGRARRQFQGTRFPLLRAEASNLLATLGVSIVQEALMEKETLGFPGSACRGHPQTNLEGRAEGLTVKKAAQ